MQRFWFLFSVLVLFVVGAQVVPSRSAWADTGSENEAKNHFQTGLRLYKEGAVDSALIQFREAYRLGNRASALRNVAQCQRDLKDFAAAHGSFERLLSNHGSELSVEDRQNVSRALSELALVTGFVEVKVGVQGGSVELNGLPVGITPIDKPIRANVGLHRIRVTKDHHTPFEATATVVAEKTISIDVNLQPEVQTGHVVIRARGDGQVPVFVDDVQVGVTPWEGDLPPGQYRIQLKDERSSSTMQSLQVVVRSRHELTLESLAKFGRVDVSATPLDATIEIGGQVVGRGTWSGELAAGLHRLRVSAPGFLPQSTDIEVTRGRVHTQTIMLAPVELGPATTGDPGTASRGGEKWDGPYFGLALQADLVGAAIEHPECPANTGATCKQMRPIGGALFVRLGYSFGFIGFEMVGSGRFQMVEDSREFQNIPEEQHPDSPYLPYAFYRREIFQRYDIGAFLGAGPRLNTQGRTRFTSGLAFGANFRSFNLSRSVGGGTKSFPARYVAPSLVFDTGLMFGATPGAKVSFGLLGQVDFPGSDVFTDPDTRYFEDVFRNKEDFTYSGPAPQYLMAKGPQFFFGPVLGAQWGH